MIPIYDRKPRLPGRRLIEPENGSQPFYAVIKRADDPFDEGTQLNAYLFKTLFGSTWYGTCSTAGATAAKVADISGFILSPGALVAVKFTYLNTAVSPTLNVTNTGAKPIYYGSSYVGANQITAGMTALFVYNGTQWMLLNPAESTQTSVGSYVGTGAYGINNPNVISLPFTPRFFAILPKSHFANWSMYYFIGASGVSIAQNGFSGGFIEYTMSGGLVSWFSRENRFLQANYEGYTYSYFALS